MGKKRELILENVKAKFANARELCPGMANEMYLLTDYISEVANDAFIPTGLCSLIAIIMYDLKRGKNGFKSDEPLPDNIMSNASQIIAQLAYLPQVVDAIADEEYANEFRVLCYQIFKIAPPRRVTGETKKGYPEYVEAAVNWWAGAIQSPKFDNGDEYFTILATALANSRPPLTEEQIRKFKDTLAEEIMADIRAFGKCSLYVDYHPCDLLHKAGQVMRINGLDLFPCKTRMNITDSIVEVSEGYGAPMEVIWTNEKTKDQDEHQTPGMKHK